MKRNIIRIDEEKCDGCGLCIPNCHEGALQVIDGKARLISDLFCDGLGACLGHCPQGAITMEAREAEPYNERMVMEQILPKGRNTILAHLSHLKEHKEHAYLNEAISFIKEKGVDLSDPVLDQPPAPSHGKACGCAGSMPVDFNREKLSDMKIPQSVLNEPAAKASELSHWPVQLHLLNPSATYLRGRDVVLASDCSAFAAGDFHQRFLKGKALAIACPKLDTAKDIYVEKIAAMISGTMINTLTVVMMEVPCCGGLMQLAKAALQKAGRKIPLKEVILSIQGDLIKEEWT